MCVVLETVFPLEPELVATFFFSRDTFLFNACDFGTFIGLPAVDDSSWKVKCKYKDKCQ